MPTASAADDQSAGGMSAADVAAEVERLSSLNSIGYNSNIIRASQSQGVDVGNSGNRRN